MTQNVSALARTARLSALLAALSHIATAQATAQEGGWQGWPDFSTGAQAPQAPGATPASPPAAETSTDPIPFAFEALLTADGQRIEQGLIWRIYQAPADPAGKARLLSTHKGPNPTVDLKPGAYIVNAAFGRAHMTRRVSVKPGEPTSEQFVLNAGGLRVKATVNGAPPASTPVTFGVFDDERDQFNNRTPVMTGAKTELIHRLNAGLYQIVSKFGDANVSVIADVTVEAGKLTEVTLAHTCAPTTFRLVARAGGEALPETRWVIQTRAGQIVKETAGALPTHVLAAGPYTVIAKSDGREFRRDFEIAGGGPTQVEVVMQ